MTLASPAAAQTRAKASADPDMREMAAYALTMDTLQKVDRAMRAMAAELKKDPRFAEQAKIKSELEALKKKDELSEADEKRGEQLAAKLEALESNTDMNMSDAKTLSDMAAKIERFPPAMNALRREGLTARDFAKFTMATIQAGLAAGMKKAGLLKEIPEGTNPANVTFMIEHEADFQKMQQAWAELGK